MNRTRVVALIEAAGFGRCRWVATACVVACIFTVAGTATAVPPVYSIVPLGLDDFEHTRNDGYKESLVYRQLNEAGQAIGESKRFSGGSTNLGRNAWLYDGATTIKVGLVDSEHTAISGVRDNTPQHINEAGQVVGRSTRYNSGSTFFGTSVWLYDGTTTIKVGLTDGEHTSSGGFKDSGILEMNEAGQVVGISARYGGFTGRGDWGQSMFLYDGTTTINVGLTGSEHTSIDGQKYSGNFGLNSLNAAGHVIGYSQRFNGGNTSLGYSAWLYDGATTIDIGLTGAEHTRNDGYRDSGSIEQAEAGQVVGYSERFNGGSTYMGLAAWLYNGATTVEIGLTGHEHTRNDGYKNSLSFGAQISAAGHVNGVSQRFNGGSTNLGQSTWLYNGTSTIPTGLVGPEHTRNDGYKFSDIEYESKPNDAGQASGISRRYNGGSADLGQSAWLYNGTATIDIGLTGAEHTRNDGYKSSDDFELNAAGHVIGYSQRFNGGNTSLGYSAWLYDGATTIDIGLTGAEHTRNDGYKSSNFGVFFAWNAAGQVGGQSVRFNGGSTQLGQDAWLYDPVLNETFALNLSARSDGYAYSIVYYLGEDGLVVGSYTLFDALDINLGNRAFYFTIADGMHDLGSLVDGGLSAGDWEYLASAIRGNGLGQILGNGTLTQSAGQMAFLLTPVPEPSSIIILAFTSLIWTCSTTARGKRGK